MLSSILAQIKIANSYNTNLGNRVVFGPPPDASEYNEAAIYYYPIAKQISVENCRWEHRQQWEVVAILFTNAAILDIPRIEADIWKALETDRSWGGAIDNLSPAEDAVQYEIATQGKQAIKVTVRFETLKRTPIFVSS